MLRCPACFCKVGSFRHMAEHFLLLQEKSDPEHVMWLNRNISGRREGMTELADSLRSLFSHEKVSRWIIEKMRDKFFGENPHPYIVRMQHPDRYLLLGYAFEHHHFLKQWVRSCSLIIANTDKEDVQMYEIANIVSEWYGTEKTPSHHELLLRMAESYGASRKEIYETKPLPATVSATAFWDKICRNYSFIEGMSAMHTLELIADRKMRDYGANLPYFDPEILHDNSVSSETVAFLREGYEADVYHAGEALELIDKYSAELSLEEPCMAVALASMDRLYDYLLARMKRGEMIENQQH